VSRRYVDDEPEFYVPQVWRGRSADKKQGSEGEVKLGTLDEAIVSDSPYDALSAYKALLKAGVAPEQARMVLPQSMFTEWYWTGNLYAFSNVFVQRTDSHAQRECQDIAHQIGTIIEPLFPVSWKALTS
jgi:thymidylate synthase (FAD)